MPARGAAAANSERQGRQRLERSAEAAAPSFGVLDQRQVRARAERRQARFLFCLAAACVTVPLVLAAAGRALLESDQLRSDTVQNQIAQALQVQQDDQLQRAELVAPSRILSVAEGRLHMVTPTGVAYLKPVNPGETVAEAHAGGVGSLGGQDLRPSNEHDRSREGSRAAPPTAP